MGPCGPGVDSQGRKKAQRNLREPPPGGICALYIGIRAPLLELFIPSSAWIRVPLAGGSGCRGWAGPDGSCVL